MTLDVDFIKIDASIIRNLDRDKNARVIAETIVGFARRTGTRTVAEYVHSREIYDIVRSLGIDFSQGFYLGEPQVSSIMEPGRDGSAQRATQGPAPHSFPRPVPSGRDL